MMKILRNHDHEPLAMFELEDDGKVTATYVRPAMKDDFEGHGILFNGKVWRPQDGAGFLDALDADLARSSTIYVQTVSDEDDVETDD